MLKAITEEDILNFRYKEADLNFPCVSGYYLHYPSFIYKYKGLSLCMGGLVTVTDGVAGIWTCVSKDAQKLARICALGLYQIWKACKTAAINAGCRRIQSVAEDTKRAKRINTIGGLSYEGRMHSYYGIGQDGLMFGMLLK